MSKTNLLKDTTNLYNRNSIFIIIVGFYKILHTENDKSYVLYISKNEIACLCRKQKEN